LAAVRAENFVTVARYAAVDSFQPDQRAPEAGGSELLQRRAAKEIGFVHLAEAVEAGFPNVDGVRNLVAVKRHTSFQAQRVARAQTARDNSEFLACFHHLVPHALAGGDV